MNNLIKRYMVEKLHGLYTYNIIFDDKVKIFIGENGTGKTTVMNLLNYMLKKDFNSMSQYKFDKVEIEFYDGTILAITNKQIDYIKQSRGVIGNSRLFFSLKQSLSSEELEELVAFYKETPTDMGIPYLDKIFSLGIGRLELSRMISYIISQGYTDNLVKTINEKIKGCKVLPLPTFRRVEFGNLFGDDNNNILLREKEGMLKSFDHESLKFGMSDVQKKINDLCKDVREETKSDFSNISKEMLLDLARNDSGDNKIKVKVDMERLLILLNRIEHKITKEECLTLQDAIVEYEENQENEKFNQFIVKLVRVYEKENKKEIALKLFIEICNKYLKNKKFLFDESSVTVTLDIDGRKNVGLEILSSGEKHIIGIFASLYLELDKNLIVLIDEPEISISVAWQKMILKDIADAPKCVFLFVATHSAFIFKDTFYDNTENILRYRTVGEEI